MSTLIATFDKDNKTVTLDLATYMNLVSSDYLLGTLQNGGVDNWDYYDYAIESLHEEFEPFKKLMAEKFGLTVDDIDDMLD